MKTNRKEAAVKAGVQAYLDTRSDFFYWRQNTSAGFAPSGQFMRSNLSGVSDFVGLQATLVTESFMVGRFVGIECKREWGGEQSEDQKKFQRNIERHGGLYVLASSVKDVELALGPVRVFIVKEKKKRVVPR